jgi:nucleotide-binding universal stress UspA family protein
MLSSKQQVHTMFKKILVPTGLADKNEKTIRMALDLAVQSGANVYLLHVLEQLGGDTDDEMQAFYQKLGEKADRALTQWQTRFQEEFPGVHIEKNILLGKRVQEIIGFCEKNAIDLIVMASRSLDTSQQPFGTLSHQVALFSPVSVLVVR